MKVQKQEVLALLANTSMKENLLYNELFAIFSKTPGRLTSQLNHLNRVGFSTASLQTVKYELRKLYGISEIEIKKAKAKAGVEAVKAPKLPSFLERFITAVETLADDVKLRLLIILKLRHDLPLTDQVDLMSEDLKCLYDDAAPFENFKNLFPELNEEFASTKASKEFLDYLGLTSYPDEFKEEIQDLLVAKTPLIDPIVLKQDEEAVAEALKAFEAAPDDVKEAIKFRDEFPFLNNVETPTELKALVTDKFTHYNKFCDAHKELLDRVVLPLEGKEHFEAETISNEAIFKLAKKAVENFTLDQTIYDELVSYRDNGKVLGIHPVFKYYNLKNSVDEMSISDASKRATLLDNYIRRDIKNVETSKTPEEKGKYQQKVDSWKEEKELIKAKLDGAGK